ncbi:MAG: hypothetical protein II561_02285 [Thermoguttaceae bacterium]|nr:hypothetical protein [Thermoguttaceae bacterium]MBQ2040490.1 hypothetical protein [Thermoguttaceae bacterium]MBQ2555357.1 hypothetical protein [Thermoguttaceae bacterium]MBQ5366063.1 hypothetical protein [Thermoguttaceae bacterium]
MTNYPLKTNFTASENVAGIFLQLDKLKELRIDLTQNARFGSGAAETRIFCEKSHFRPSAYLVIKQVISKRSI